MSDSVKAPTDVPVEGWRHVLHLTGRLVIAILFFYLAGVGPAFRQMLIARSHGEINRPLTTLYAPLYWLRDQIPPLAGIVGWYQQMWAYDILREME